jgi:hypothetical protein
MGNTIAEPLSTVQYVLLMNVIFYQRHNPMILEGGRKGMKASNLEALWDVSRVKDRVHGCIDDVVHPCG